MTRTENILLEDDPTNDTMEYPWSAVSGGIGTDSPLLKAIETVLKTKQRKTKATKTPVATMPTNFLSTRKTFRPSPVFLTAPGKQQSTVIRFQLAPQSDLFGANRAWMQAQSQVTAIYFLFVTVLFRCPVTYHLLLNLSSHYISSSDIFLPPLCSLTFERRVFRSFLFDQSNLFWHT